MESTLMKYEALSAAQCQQVLLIELADKQKAGFGDVHGALHLLTARPLSDVQGYVLLVDEVPRGFFVLKRRSLLPSWAQGLTATLHGMMIDQRHQGAGFGRTCLQRLPQLVSELWPEIEQLKLAVHPANLPAISLYQATGWVFSDDTTPANGCERQMVRSLR
jgi:GNAT superfamily N-acetyltransferase